MDNKLLKKNDILIAVFIILVSVIAILLLRGNSNALKAVVTVNGDVTEINLSAVEEPYIIKTDTSPQTVISVEKNCIYFKDSNCDNKLCVNSGKLTSKGAVAVCLPARVVISIESDNTVDAVTF